MTAGAGVKTRLWRTFCMHWPFNVWWCLTASCHPLGLFWHTCGWPALNPQSIKFCSRPPQALRGRVPDMGQAEIKYFPWNNIADEIAMLDALKASARQRVWLRAAASEIVDLPCAKSAGEGCTVCSDFQCGRWCGKPGRSACHNEPTTSLLAPCRAGRSRRCGCQSCFWTTWHRLTAPWRWWPTPGSLGCQCSCASQRS